MWNNKPLTLVGAGAATTVVDGRGPNSVLSISNVPASASVRGFTFTNGRPNSTDFGDRRTWGVGLWAATPPVRAVPPTRTLPLTRVRTRHNLELGIMVIIPTAG